MQFLASLGGGMPQGPPMNMAGGGLVRNYQDGGLAGLIARLEDPSLTPKQRAALMAAIQDQKDIMAQYPDQYSDSPPPVAQEVYDPYMDPRVGFNNIDHRMTATGMQPGPAQGPTGGLSGLVSQLGAGGAGSAPPTPAPPYDPALDKRGLLSKLFNSRDMPPGDMELLGDHMTGQAVGGVLDSDVKLLGDLASSMSGPGTVASSGRFTGPGFPHPLQGSNPFPQSFPIPFTNDPRPGRMPPQGGPTQGGPSRSQRPGKYASPPTELQTLEGLAEAASGMGDAAAAAAVGPAIEAERERIAMEEGLAGAEAQKWNNPYWVEKFGQPRGRRQKDIKRRAEGVVADRARNRESLEARGITIQDEPTRMMTDLSYPLPAPPFEVSMEQGGTRPPMLPPGAPDSVAPQRPANIPNIVQQDQRFNFEDAYNKNLDGLGADPRVAQMEALQAQIAGRSGPDWRPAAQLQFALGMMGGRTVGEGIRAGMEGAAPYMQAGALETSRQEGQALRDQLSSLERMSASESERRREARDMTRFQYDQEKSERAFKENVRQFNESLSVNKQNKALELALSQFREEMDISQFKSGEKRKVRDSAADLVQSQIKVMTREPSPEEVQLMFDRALRMLIGQSSLGNID
jgi:hypothetical protein